MNFEVIRPEHMDPGPNHGVHVPIAHDPSILSGKALAVLAAPCPEQLDVVFFCTYFRARGATVHVVAPRWVGPRLPLCKFWKPTLWCGVDKYFEDSAEPDYDAWFLPGGPLSSSMLRGNYAIQGRLSLAMARGKVVCSTGHGAHVLVSAGLCKGRKVACSPDMQWDVRNAGGIYLALPSCEDGNLVTGRDPLALPEFCDRVCTAMLRD